jgi:putative AbiEi antitoxin of type IV toxin-antitoxin system
MRPQDSTLAQLASSSHGVVTRAQLLAAGFTVAQIKSRLRTGTLLREYAGVYRVGHRAPSVEARYLAAVWACGRGALLSGRAAGYLLGILAHPPLHARSDGANAAADPGDQDAPKPEL